MKLPPYFNIKKSLQKNLYLLFLIYGFTVYGQPDSAKNLINLSLEELTNVKVTTVSKAQEKLSLAPASVRIITKKEIEQRGYNNLVEIFQDLAGIDLSVAYGDTYYKAYWRGFRTGMADSWLFMIDGRIMNHLWYNFNDVMIAVPLSNIERIEIVYGPASVLYGPNAMSGVINVITRTDKNGSGTSANVKIKTGSNNTRIMDMNLFYKSGNFRFSITGYYATGELDTNSLSQFEYTKSKYLTDRKLWGDYVDHPNIAGVVSSPANNKGLSMAIIFDEFTFGFNYFVDDNGYGINYPFDKMQIKAKWIEPEYDLYLQNKHSFGDNFSVNTLLRYRNCDVSNESNSIESVNESGAPRYVKFGYWQSKNRSVSFSQDYEFNPYEFLNTQFGINYHNKDLNRAYELPYGPALKPEEIKNDTQTGQLPDSLFPEPPENTFQSQRRASWVEEGIYLQTKISMHKLFNWDNEQIFNVGVRADAHSYYGDNTIIRLGYTGVYSHFRFKLLFGQAYKEPAPRQLYGGWTALGSNPNLKPEISDTYEMIFGYNRKKFDIAINPYINKMRNLIMDIGTPKNHGKTETYGFDLTAQSVFDLYGTKNLKIQSSYSFVETIEEKYDSTGRKTGTGIIGDMANHKFHLLINYSYKNILFYLSNRYIGDRKTVDTNPLKKVDGYCTTDIQIKFNNIKNKNISVALKINNIFNTKYAHAGIRKANSGNTPGYWENQNWYGSNGWYNSLLPQPLRSVFFTLEYEF